MKNKYLSFYTKVLFSTLLVFLICITTTTQAQSPQYYNYNTVGDGGNSYPLNQSIGQRVQLLYRPGVFNHPVTSTSGYITSISIMVDNSYPLGPWVYHEFTIKLGQTGSVDLPTADFYTGPLSTVYYRSTVILSSAGGWMTLPLDMPFYYDTTQSLVVEVSQSTIDGSVSGYSWANTVGSGYTRLYSSPGSYSTFQNADGSQYHLGLDILDNDSCESALTVTPGTIVHGTTTGAPVQNVSTCNTVLNTAPGKWYKFIATDVLSIVSTCTGTSFDSKIGVFEGNCDSLICVNGNDDACGLQSRVFACTTPGTEYYVYVTGFASSNGAFDLSITCGPSAAPYFNYYLPNYTQASDPGGNCDAFVAIPVPVFGMDFWDDCGATIINDYTGTDDASAIYPVGSTVVTWTITDAENNSDSYQQTITVVDAQAPILHCPADIVQSTDPGACQAVVNYTPPVGDESCPSTITPVALSHSNTQTVVQGIACAGAVVTYNRLAVIFDLPALGYSAGFQTDTLEFAISQAIALDGDQLVKINLYALSGPMDTLNLTLIHSMSVQIPDTNNALLKFPFSTFIPAGTQLVYEVEIPDGTAETNYIRIGTNLDGQTTPSYILASDCGVPNFTDLATLGITDAYIMNIYGTMGGGTYLTSGIGSGGVFPVGTTTEVYQSSDAAGNFSICSMNITVEDNEAPMVISPADITINTTSCVEQNVGCSIQNGFAGAFDPYYWDFYQINADGNADLSAAPDTVILTGGNNQSDNAGYTNASIPITCNGDITFDWNYTGGDSALYDVPQYSLDGGVTYMPIPGFSTNGPINQTGTSTIAVQDGQSFVLSIFTHDNMYGAATLIITNFSGSAAPMPVFSDNCGIASVSSNHPSSEFEAGETIVTWTVTDIHGNTTNVDQTITINESTDPVVTCPSDIEITTTSSVGEIYLYNVTANDNCAVTNLIQTAGLPSGSQFPIGVTTNSWTATDASGNTGSCSFTVTVIDVTSLGESGETAVNVYPNPASEIVYAELPVGFEGTIVSLYNAEGSLVRSYGACNEKLAEFDINGLTEGVYFMKFENQHTSFYKKVVKN